ncbi:MAG: glycosyltransferase, partial [bacterium]|nr:glycosyltransferase [bacterium]
VRRLFALNPERTAAYFHCHFFVGPELVTITPEAYSHHSAYEWLRVWRYRPGMRWASHEPPQLVEQQNGRWLDVARINPLTHAETSLHGAVFTHYAYTLESQVKFKEIYYGYEDAVAQWQRLQQERRFPLLLKNHLQWVRDDAAADRIERGTIGAHVPPVSWPWSGEEAGITTAGRTGGSIVIDGVIFQLQAGRPRGISRVWQNLIPELKALLPNRSIIVLQREGFPLPIKGIERYEIPAYAMGDDVLLDRDDAMLTETCRKLGADLFLSTYCTRAPGILNVLTIHDLIPEQFGFDLSQPEWRAKTRAIRSADRFIAVSHATGRDLRKHYGRVREDQITVAHNGCSSVFEPAGEREIKAFTKTHGIRLPYFLLVGNRGLYKNGEMLFRAAAALKERPDFQIVVVGGEALGGGEEAELSKVLNITCLPWLDDRDLRAAYSGAAALVYPSRYEGFGLPVLEAMASGCPVITTAAASIPEVGGDAVLYIDPDSLESLTDALLRVLDQRVRDEMVERGLQQADCFSWSAMAQQVAAVIAGHQKASLLFSANPPLRQSPASTEASMPLPGSDTAMLPHGPSILVSAIVSTVNSERFLRGCLEDLENQTLADRLEIIVVNSASDENEEAIVREFEKRYSNIVYVRTEERETVYGAWNRGIQVARGRYVTNANTDDRHRRDAFEVMVKILEALPEVALVYGDLLITERENESFENCTPVGRFEWLNWNRKDLLDQGCFMGPQPMWRRSVHDEYGYFDDTFVTSGDYEFWLRISQTHAFLHIPALLGLYLRSPQSVEHRNRDRQREENEKIIQLYREAEASGTIVRRKAKRVGPISIEAAPSSGLSPVSPSPLTSVIVLLSDRKGKAKRCLKRLIKNTSEPIEIIAVHRSGHGDDTDWIHRLPGSPIPITVVPAGAQEGLAPSFNAGILRASGQNLVLLQDNAVTSEGWLSRLLAHATGRSNRGIVGPMWNGSSGLQRPPFIPTETGAKRELWVREFCRRHEGREVPSRKIDSFCMLFSRRLLETVGLFDARLVSRGYETEDFCLRATLAGFQNVIAADTYIHSDGVSPGGVLNDGADCGDGADKKIFDGKWSGISPASPMGTELIVVSALERGIVAHEKGDTDGAIGTLVEAIGHAPEDRRIYDTLAEILIDAKRFDEALAVIDQRASDAGDGCTHELRGYCHEGLNNLNDAAEHGRRALSLNSDAPRALNLMGMLAYRQDDHKGAEALFKKAAGGDPAYGEPWTNLGVMAWTDGRQSEALDLLEKGCMLTPDRGDSATHYHAAAVQLNACDRAESVFREAQALYPSNRRLAFLLIGILLHQGKSMEAMAESEKAVLNFGIDQGLIAAALEIRRQVGPLVLDTRRPSASTISVCMIVKNEEQHMGRCLKSVQGLADEIIIVDTGSEDSTRELAEIFGARVYDFPWADDFAAARNFSLSKASAGWVLVLDADEAISHRDHDAIRALARKKKRKPVAYNFVTRNYTDQVGAQGWTPNDLIYQNEAGGLGWFPSIKVRLFPNHQGVHFEKPVHEYVEGTLERIGAVVEHCPVPIHHYGRLDQAKTRAKGEAYYRLGKKKLEEKSGDLKALYELAVQAGELNRYEEAADLWRQFCSLKKDDPVAIFNLGHVLLELGDYDEALVHARRAHELDPGSREFAINCSTCELYAGDVALAISRLEKILAADSEYPTAMAGLAAAYCLGGSREEGFRLLDELSRQGFNCVTFMHDTARGLMAAGRFIEALTLLQAAVDSDNVHPETQSLMGECRGLLGRTEAAYRGP